MDYVGIETPEESRIVTRAHVIAWREDLAFRELAPATIRRKLSALASLYNYLCEANAVPQNPVHGVSRPNQGANEGKTPAIGPKEALALLRAPDAETLVGKRDRAILSTLLYQGLRREELVKLRVKDLHHREGVMHLEVQGKGGKIRFVAWPRSPSDKRQEQPQHSPTFKIDYRLRRSGGSNGD
jgi:site-specific recombinase XerD